MHIVLVHIHIKAEAIDDFKKATIENARNSVKEPGIAQFSCLQQAEDPSRFTLLEVYRTPDDQLKHRETKHYQVWRDAVADMMADPRQGIKYVIVYPNDEEWK